MNLPLSNPPRFLLAGHVTRDHVDDETRAGGSVTYAGGFLRALDIPTTVFTSVHSMEAIPEPLHDIELIVESSDVTTTFHNEYNSDERLMRCSDIASRLEVPSDLVRQADGIFLAPVAGEIDIGSINFDTFPETIGLNLQGFLKSQNDRGKFVPDRSLHDILTDAPSRSVGFCSEEDLLKDERTGHLKPEVDVLHRTHGEKGSDVFHDGKLSQVPVVRTDPVDPTGAGDVFAIATLIHHHQQESHDPVASGCFGAAAASMVIEVQGVRYNYPAEELDRRFQQLTDRLER